MITNTGSSPATTTAAAAAATPSPARSSPATAIASQDGASIPASQGIARAGTAAAQDPDEIMTSTSPIPTSPTSTFDHGISASPKTEMEPTLSAIVSPTDTIANDADGGEEIKTQASPVLKQVPTSGVTSPSPLDTNGLEGRSDIEAASQCSQPDRIRSLGDVGDAFVLAWHNQKKSLFTSWVHVPIGILFLLFLCWAIKLAIDRAPFRFPAPVIGMAVLFFLLLLLDRLSSLFPGQHQAETDPEKMAEARNDPSRKRFVDPVMKLLAPPCDFCLRNMSVMFTPSFILIPAREVIPGREIGLLTAWFAISQVCAFVFPVLLHRFYTWVGSQPKRFKRRNREKHGGQGEVSRTQSRRSSIGTLTGGDLAKQISASGSRKLSAIATGLNDLGAVIASPVNRMTKGKSKMRYEDERLQITHVQIETARQQGDPAVATPAEIANVTGSPLTPYDGVFQHRNHFHQHHLHYHQHHYRNDIHQQPPGLRRGRSMTKAIERRQSSSSTRDPNARPRAPKRSQSVPVAPAVIVSPAKPASPPSSSRTTYFPPAAGGSETFGERLARYRLDDDTLRSKKLSVVFDEDAIVAELRRPSKADSQLTVMNPRTSCSDNVDDEKKAAVLSNPEAKQSDKAIVNIAEEEAEPDSASPADDGEGANRRISLASSSGLGTECEHNAVERLSEWIADLITPTVYLVLFVVGVPLFYIYDFALPLFLGINMLTFLAAIMLVPPAWRRYLHPILTTSVATVLIIWAFGEIKGNSLAGALGYYSNGAKYSVLWDLDGYRGPVPGAGDVLFSTLDAGIVALAVPMYRYRRDLAENFTRMMLILVPCAALSLFFWPWIGNLFGLDAERALAFSARFMSTPLAIEMANNVGADESITVIMVVVTGILAAILKEPFFKLMRISMDDHICVGVTMGSTAGAIGASSLISRPRVMAVASLAFVLFGTLLLICAAIPAIVDVVRTLAGAATGSV